MLYKYCNPNGIDILINRRLKASKIVELNDPFELAFGIDSENALENLTGEYKNNPKILRFWKKLLKKSGVQFETKSTKDIIEKTARFQVSDLHRVALIIGDHFNNTNGIISLTEKPSVIQMWSHYAGNHSGLVVGVEEQLFINDIRALVVVQYAKDMPLLPVTGDVRKFKEYEKHLLGLMGRKEEMWVYENERRLYLGLTDIPGVLLIYLN